MTQSKQKPLYHSQPLQQDIAHALLHPDTPMAPSLDAAINHGAISAAARLDIYKNNVIGGLTEIVLARYPAISALVGDEFSRAMAREYVLSSPAKSANMNEYAANYPDFIRAFSPAQDIAFLPDIAALEGLEHHAYYAPDGVVLSLINAAEFVPKIMAGTAKLGVHPSCGFLRSAYPILSLRDFARTCGDGAPDFDLDAGAQHVIIWRFGFRIEALSIDAPSYAFFETLQDTQDVHSALNSALEVDTTFNFETFLQQMMPRDVFTIA
jgi:hypothetical protein